MTDAVLVALLAVIPAAANAQVHPRQAEWSFRTPAITIAEHALIHAALARATALTGETGTIARQLAAQLEPHFAKEEQFALPPLTLLRPLARGEFTPSMAEVLPLTDRLRTEYETLIAEHRTIRQTLTEFSRAAWAEHRYDCVRLADDLKNHAREEEEVAYPAAMLVGEYVRLALGAMTGVVSESSH